MRSIAHDPMSNGKAAALAHERLSVSPREVGLTLGRALGLGFSLIGISALVMLVFGLAHEGFGSTGPTLRIVATHEDGRTIRATVEGLGSVDCPRWRDRLGAAIGNAGLKVEKQECGE